jgi:uncharacterized phage protein (TIGR02218 family)
VSPVADADGRVVGRRVRRGRGAADRRSLPRAVAKGPAGVPEGFGYDVFERSTFLGEPVEGFRFAQAATVWRFTSADVDVNFSTGTYVREAIVHEALDYSQEDTAGNAVVRVPKGNAVAALYVSYIPTSKVNLTIYRKHRGDPQEIAIFIGTVVSCSFEGPEAVLLCAPISQSLGKKVPSIVFGSQCNWNLYGTGCTASKAAFSDPATVSSVSGLVVRAAAFALRPDGWFDNGWLETTDAQRRFIVSHVGDALTLMNSFPSLAVGASVTAVAGCQRTEAICQSKFANLVNHLGFPRVPTRNPYEGSVV